MFREKPDLMPDTEEGLSKGEDEQASSAWLLNSDLTVPPLPPRFRGAPVFGPEAVGGSPGSRVQPAGLVQPGHTQVRGLGGSMRGDQVLDQDCGVNWKSLKPGPYHLPTPLLLQVLLPRRDLSPGGPQPDG